MNIKEAYLYHQIHPLKLLADIGSGFGSLYPLWEHQLAIALVVMLVPPPVASFIVLRYANLEPYKQSAFGKYVAQYLQGMEAVRLAGMVMMALGAWYHSVGIILGGLGLVLFVWLRGKIFPRPAKRGAQAEPDPAPDRDRV
jgi:hypothetical protein